MTPPRKTAAKADDSAGAATEPVDLAGQLEPVDPAVLADMSLAARLAHITAEVKGVPKAGQNEHFNYRYQRAEDVAAAISPLLGRYEVTIIPQLDMAHVGIDETGRSTRAGAAIRDYRVPISMWIACPTGDRVVPWGALANDDSDKGLNKAITAATKSFLRAAFLIPLPDDDTDSTTGSTPHADGQRAQWDGEVPDVSDATVNGTVVILGPGRLALSYSIEPRTVQTTVNGIVRQLGGRFDREGKHYAIPEEANAEAVALARGIGLTIPPKVAERYPAPSSAPPPAQEPPPAEPTPTPEEAPAEDGTSTPPEVPPDAEGVATEQIGFPTPEEQAAEQARRAAQDPHS
jgi:hypothetical protein